MNNQSRTVTQTISFGKVSNYQFTDSINSAIQSQAKDIIAANLLSINVNPLANGLNIWNTPLNSGLNPNVNTNFTQLLKLLSSAINSTLQWMIIMTYWWLKVCLIDGYHFLSLSMTFLLAIPSFSAYFFYLVRSLSLQISKITTVLPIWIPCWCLFPTSTFILSYFTNVPNFDLLSKIWNPVPLNFINAWLRETEISVIRI